MTVSARLSPRIRSALARYCRNQGITKTAALERGIQLLLKEASASRHAAFLAFERMRDRLPGESGADESSADLKRHLDEKYPA